VMEGEKSTLMGHVKGLAMKVWEEEVLLVSEEPSNRGGTAVEE
jgi:hypothetical protein